MEILLPTTEQFPGLLCRPGIKVMSLIHHIQTMGWECCLHLQETSSTQFSPMTFHLVSYAANGSTFTYSGWLHFYIQPMVSLLQTVDGHTFAYILWLHFTHFNIQPMAALLQTVDVYTFTYCLWFHFYKLWMVTLL